MRGVKNYLNVYSFEPWAGSSLRCYIDNVSFAQLYHLIGMPDIGPANPGSESKILLHWTIKYKGVPLTIYLWKWEVYPGFYERVTWNIGGHPENQSSAIQLAEDIALEVLNLPIIKKHKYSIYGFCKNSYNHLDVTAPPKSEQL